MDPFTLTELQLNIVFVVYTSNVVMSFLKCFRKHAVMYSYKCDIMKWNRRQYTII